MSALDGLVVGRTVCVTTCDGSTIFGEVLQRHAEKRRTIVLAWGGRSVALDDADVRSVRDASTTPRAKIVEVAREQAERLKERKGFVRRQA